jgi:hypothetical protein
MEKMEGDHLIEMYRGRDYQLIRMKKIYFQEK